MSTHAALAAYGKPKAWRFDEENFLLMLLAEKVEPHISEN